MTLKLKAQVNLRDTLKVFCSAVFWNGVGLILTALAVGILIVSLLFDESEMAWRQ